MFGSKKWQRPDLSDSCLSNITEAFLRTGVTDAATASPTTPLPLDDGIVTVKFQKPSDGRGRETPWPGARPSWAVDGRSARGSLIQNTRTAARRRRLRVPVGSASTKSKEGAKSDYRGGGRHKQPWSSGLQW